MTAIEGDIETLKYLNKDNFRQIYQVGLPKECGVDYMLNAISALYAVDGIKFVCPNYMIATESAELQKRKISERRQEATILEMIIGINGVWSGLRRWKRRKLFQHWNRKKLRLELLIRESLNMMN